MVSRIYPSHPLVGVGAVVLVGDNVLLVKRAAPPGKGKWSIPGGLVEVGEKLGDAVLRELYEETGVTGSVVGLIDVFEYIELDSNGNVRYHYILLDFLVKPNNMNVRASSDVLDARFYSIDYALRELELTKTTRRLLEKIKRHGVRVVSYFDILAHG